MIDSYTGLIIVTFMIGWLMGLVTLYWFVDTDNQDGYTSCSDHREMMLDEDLDHVEQALRIANS